MVFFRRSDVISTGDVFSMNGYPNIDLANGGSIQGEIAALNRIIEIAVPEITEEGGTMIIPGHGRLCDEADVVQYRDMMTILRDRVAVSKDAEALVQHAIGGSYDLLFNGVELDDYRNAEPWPTVGPTIFFCGRHEERKGLDVLIDAMSRLPEHVHLWVASNGPDTERLMQRAAGDHRIEWLGRISEDEKIARLRGADVFCAPSLHGESFGVVLIEAMAAGTAIVASALDGYRNVATSEVDALLVPPGDAVALAGALRRVLTDSELSQRLVAAGHVRSTAFSMRRLAERYAEIYRELKAVGAGQRPRLPWFVSRRRRSVSRMMG